MNTRLSIVMPSYNQSGFLEEAIRSVVSQIEHVHEFIVLDGGSTDGSVEIIKQYEQWITHWQSAPDGGQSNAIADGFARCTGDVIAFLNSDDAYLPGALDAVVDAFDSDPRLGFLEGNTVVADADSRVIRCDRRIGPSAGWVRWGHLRVHQPSSFFRRSAYESVGGIDRSLECVLDTELWYRLIPACRCRKIQKYLAVHRIHDDAKGSSWVEKYAIEKTMLDRKYPRLRKRRVRHTLGQAGVYLTRVLTGRQRRADRDTSRFVGQRIDEVFGCPRIGCGSDTRSATRPGSCAM